MLTVVNAPAAPKARLRFEVAIQPGLVTTPQTGRLLVALGRDEKEEPRLSLGEAGEDAPFALARDVEQLAPGRKVIVDATAISFPFTHLIELPPGDYFVQAVLDSNPDLRSPKSPGNLHSRARKLHLDPARAQTVSLELCEQTPAETLPAETEFVKYVKLRSKLLSEFHHRPIYLRAGIVLPRDYGKEPNRRYPLWVEIGGFTTRCTAVSEMMRGESRFRKTWLADQTPRMILLQLDGAGPLGDPYQVNSANNGPYGDALTQELIPYVEQQFHAIGEPKARVLSGVSTGGWVSLALQVFYPDYFNGVWSSSPDGVDFRAFQLVNIYQDTNAYVNRFGFERPSERTVTGEVQLTMRHEVQIENVLGRGNCWALSGGQWGAWNAVYGPRGRDGLPVPLWDPQSGRINREVVEHWKQYDLRLVLEKNWPTLGPKLRGKLHICVGDADNYFLNNGVHLLDEFLSRAQPPYEGRIAYGPGEGHGWWDIPLLQRMQEMEARTGPARE